MATALVTKKSSSGRSKDAKRAASSASTRNVKTPTLTAKTAARMGHPRGSSAHPHSGRFGPWGGRYVPETLMAACEELEREYEKAKRDPRFKARLGELLKSFAGRPTPLFLARRLGEKLGGAKIYLKREDLLHTGAH